MKEVNRRGDETFLRDSAYPILKGPALVFADYLVRGPRTGLRARITPNHIGKYGQLQEWLEGKRDPKDEHRHV
jgi:alpha-L-fucosidase 2